MFRQPENALLSFGRERGVLPPHPRLGYFRANGVLAIVPLGDSVIAQFYNKWLKFA